MTPNFIWPWQKEHETALLGFEGKSSLSQGCRSTPQTIASSSRCSGRGERGTSKSSSKRQNVPSGRRPQMTPMVPIRAMAPCERASSSIGYRGPSWPATQRSMRSLMLAEKVTKWPNVEFSRHAARKPMVARYRRMPHGRPAIRSWN